jgi:hypothetical protein
MKYPLKPLLDHRAAKVDDALTALAAAVRTREAAADARARAEQAKSAEESATERAKKDVDARLGRGELRAVDLAHAHAFEIGAEARAQALGASLERAISKEGLAANEENAARDGLARAKADRDVVVKHRAKHEERMRKDALTAEEEAAEDAFAGARR